MIFTAGPSTKPLPFQPTSDISIDEFLFSDKYGHLRVSRPSDALVCGLTGKAYSTQDVEDKAGLMARALAQELGWNEDVDSQRLDKERVVAIYSANTIDYLVVTIALHRLGAAALLIHPTNTATEFRQHLQTVSADAVFTCAPLLTTCLEACHGLIDKSHTYILDLPGTADIPALKTFKSTGQLFEQGKKEPELPPRRSASVAHGEGTEGERERTAFYCASSGTSGFQKLVRVSHYNVISNVLQLCTFEDRHHDVDRALGLLPLSHAFALVVAYTMLYRGDGFVVLPKFDMQQMLKTIQLFRLTRLYLVPPILVALIKNPFLLNMFDLSTVDSVVVGAAPLEARVAEQMQKLCPKWQVLQGYGLTEAAVVVSYSTPGDVMLSSSGSLLPNVEARLVAVNGNEHDGSGDNNNNNNNNNNKYVKDLDTPGELYLRSPSIVAGYVNDETANRATFTADGWLRTGDMAVFRRSPASGAAHLCIVDRLKDLIKVRGLQVSPAEIEAELVTHPAVAQAAVIPVPDDSAGEVPRAVIMLQPDALKEGGGEDAVEALKEQIAQVVEDSKSQSHFLKGGVVFVDSIPTSQSGKVLKKVLREQYGAR